MRRLELLFKNEDGKTVTVSVDNPVEPVNPLAVSEAMDNILAQNVIYTTGGELVSKQAARIVERSVTEVDISI